MFFFRQRNFFLICFLKPSTIYTEKKTFGGRGGPLSGFRQLTDIFGDFSSLICFLEVFEWTKSTVFRILKMTSHYFVVLCAWWEFSQSMCKRPALFFRHFLETILFRKNGIVSRSKKFSGIDHFANWKGLHVCFWALKGIFEIKKWQVLPKIGFFDVFG